MDVLLLIERCVWSGLAALGFAVLFNVPQRTLLAIFGLAAGGAAVKLALLGAAVNPVLASFLGAATIGTLAVPTAHWKHSPPAVFSIAAVIPMVPGMYAYRMMLGVIELTGAVGDAYPMILAQTVNNGVKTLFILMALAVGVGIPNLLTRKESAKQMQLRARRRHPR
jgi:uncharacterized membrane protein YjjB (DUF3815 family)